MCVVYLAEGYAALYINFLDAPRTGTSTRIEEEITIITLTVAPFPARRKL